MLRIAVLVSGGGTNLQAIIDNIKSGFLEFVKICVVVAGRSDAYALQRAKENGIDAFVLIRKDFKDQDSYDEAMIGILGERDTDLVVTAGFMTVMGDKFINRYRHRAINVHPALVPSFCGKGYYGIIPHRKALEYGVKVSGATVHFVDPEVDAGPVILQKAIDIEGIEDEGELQRKIMEECEWKILPEAIRLISEGRVEIRGRKVYINRKDEGR